MEIMIVLAIVFVILSVAIPNVMSALNQSNEVAAQRMIGTIHTAQAQHYSQTGRFAIALGELNKLIPAKLAAGKHSGYTFQLQGTKEGYQIRATPDRRTANGARILESDETLVIRDESGNDIAR